MNYLLLFLLIGGSLFSIFSNHNNNVSAIPLQKRQQPATGDAKGGTWQIVGTTGVNAMHIFVSSPTKVIIVDKVEANPLKQANGQPAVSAEYDLTTNQLRALSVVSDTFCSAGSWLGNGTMLHSGGDNGNAQVQAGGQTLRFFDPAVGDWVERVGLMQTKRWYPTMLPLANGKVIILGGSTGGTGLNRAEINNPTYTIWPPTNGDTPDPEITFQFLIDTLPYNLYVFLHLVPNKENKNIIFVLANTQGILYDLDAQTTLVTYPKISSQRTYPQTGNSLMLPLYPDNDYQPTIMVCGGQAQMEPTSPAEASCGRLDLYAPKAAWQMDNFGGIPRVMPDSVILPDAKVLFLNGAKLGYAGFRKGPAQNPLWVNSDPAFTPVLYDPDAKTYATMNPSTVPRMYHSVASLLADGSVFVAGSNPQGNVAKNVLFPTEYRAEIYKPPYILTGAPRPTIMNIDGNAINQARIPVTYGQKLQVVVKFDSATTPIFTAAIIHLGFVTHSQNMGQRYVRLVVDSAQFDSTTAGQYIVSVTLPPNPTIIAPGPHFIYILANNIPCEQGAEVLLN